MGACLLDALQSLLKSLPLETIKFVQYYTEIELAWLKPAGFHRENE